MQNATLLTTFIRKLELRDEISSDERDALMATAGDMAVFPAGSDLVQEGDRPGECKLLIEGFCSRYRLSRDGERQITAIHIAGDFVDLHSLVLKEMDHSVGAFSDCRVVRFPHARLTRLTETHPHLTRMLWLMTLIDASTHREWLAAAARSARAQLAHLVCELYVRLRVTEPATSRRFALPLRQPDLADALGLSLVHVNRTLQQLRSGELLQWQGSEVEIVDWDGLRGLAEFDDTYLHLTSEPR
jgi:CRP-like cAMP-binding protein